MIRWWDRSTPQQPTTTVPEPAVADDPTEQQWQSGVGLTLDFSDQDFSRKLKAMVPELEATARRQDETRRAYAKMRMKRMGR